MRDLRRLEDTEKEAFKSYWRELYIGAFTTSFDDLNHMLNSPLMKILVEIEDALMNAICSPDIGYHTHG